MEINLATFIGAALGGVVSWLGTTLIMVSKFDRRIGVIETHTNSIPDLVKSMTKIEKKIAYMEGRDAAAV